MNWWQRRPAWQKVALIVLGVIVVFGAIGGGGDNDVTATTTTATASLTTVAAATTTAAAVTTAPAVDECRAYATDLSNITLNVPDLLTEGSETFTGIGEGSIPSRRPP